MGEIETKKFVEIWYLDGSRYVAECEETGVSHNQICPVLLRGAYAYRFYRAKQGLRPCGNCLRMEPGKPDEDDEMFFINCVLVGVFTINGVGFYVYNRSGETFSFLEGDTLILDGYGKNGIRVNKTYVRVGYNVEEASAS